MTQREGRILRQGNSNKSVYIFRYVTEESFDAYSWQLLETKQRFITELLSGMAEARTGEEIGNTVLDYAEVKALAIGDPNIKIRVMLNNDLVRLRTLQRARTAEFEELNLDFIKTKKMLSDTKIFVEHLESDIKVASTEVTSEAERKELRKRIYDAINSDADKAKTMIVYRGFDIIVPAHQSATEPFVYLQAGGQYKVSVGKGEKMILAKIDKYIDSMPPKLQEAKNREVLLQRRIEEIRDTFNNLPDYANEIADIRQKLDSVDLTLGINETTIRSRVLDN